MVEEDRPEPPPSLEPPSLGGLLRRRRRAEPAPATKPTPATEPASVTEPAVAAEPAETRPLPAAAEPTATEPTAAEPTAAEPTAAVELVESPQTTTETTPETPAAPREPRRPPITGMLAAVVVGGLVGLLMVVLTAGSARGCEAVQGTTACGTPGFALLVVIVVVAVLVGGLLLRALAVTDPMSTSFLAVGLACVVALLFLIDQLMDWWMVIAIPVVSAATYALSHWVTTAIIEPADRS